MAFIPESWDGYKVINTITPATDLKTYVEGLADSTATVLGKGTYGSTSWVDVYQRNLHFWVEPADRRQVFFDAGFRIRGAVPLRMTGIDFFSQHDKSVLWYLNTQLFLNDCNCTYTIGTTPWRGAFLAGDGLTRTELQNGSSGDNIIDFSKERVVGRPIQIKDVSYLRVEPSSNGYVNRVLTGCETNPAVTLAGSDAFIVDLDVKGPGRNKKGGAGINASRVGAGVYYLRRHSPPVIDGFQHGFLAQAGAQIFIQNEAGGPLPINNCENALSKSGGAVVTLDNKKVVTFKGNKNNFPVDVDDDLVFS